MVKVTPFIIFALVPLLLTFGFTVIESIVLTVAGVHTLWLALRFWRMVAPATPVVTTTKRQAIEDAVVVYSFSEAIACNQGHLIVSGLLLGAAFLVV